jgi:predicted dehydrogenase
MTHEQPVRVGIIGLGFMGRTHLGAYQAAAKEGLSCRVAAVADPRVHELLAGASGGGNLRTSDAITLEAGARAETDPKAIIEAIDVDLISICTPTDTHVDLGVAAMLAGKHVVMEKPVALTTAAISKLADASRLSGRFCFPAMVMRFWPGWTLLREMIADGRFGALRTASFTRLGSRPAWNPFYADPSRSGGALFDLHIHDADFVCWCFGRPDAVSSGGSLDHVTTQYQYSGAGSPLHVTAEGGWDQQPGWPFRMRFVANFERATVDFDLARETPLMKAQDGEWTAVAVPALGGYDAEIRHAVRAAGAAMRGEKPTLAATLQDAALVTEVLTAERQSVETGRPVRLSV